MSSNLVSFRTLRCIGTVTLDASCIAWHVPITQKAEKALLLAVPENLVCFEVRHCFTGHTAATAAHGFAKKLHVMEGLPWKDMLCNKKTMPATLEERSKLAQDCAKATQKCALCHLAADKEPKAVKVHRGVLLYCAGVETEVCSLPAPLGAAS